MLPYMAVLWGRVRLVHRQLPHVASSVLKYMLTWFFAVFFLSVLSAGRQHDDAACCTLLKRSRWLDGLHLFFTLLMPTVVSAGTKCRAVQGELAIPKEQRRGGFEAVGCHHPSNLSSINPLRLYTPTHYQQHAVSMKPYSVTISCLYFMHELPYHLLSCK